MTGTSSLKADVHQYNFSDSTNFKNQLSAEFLPGFSGKKLRTQLDNKLLKLQAILKVCGFEILFNQ